MDIYRKRNDAPVKKYNLSLKNRIPNNSPQSIESKFNITNDTSDSRDSQNFHLRVSDTFNIEDSDDDTKPVKMDVEKRSKPAKRDDGIIIISDSSDDEDSSDALGRIQAFSSQSSLTNNNNNNKRDSSINLESIEISDEDEDIFTGSLTRKKSSESSQNKSRSHKSLHYSSDEINSSSKLNKKDKDIFTGSLTCKTLPESSQNKFRTHGSLNSSSDETHFSSKVNEKDEESIIDTSNTTPVSKIRHNQTPVNSGPKLNTSERLLKATGILTNPTKRIGTPGSTKLTQCTTPISKRDAKKIMKVIRSKRLESPAVSEKRIIDETDSDSIVTDEEPDKKVVHPAWIEDSDNETSAVPKPSKTHVSRFLNPSDSSSDEKTKEIARWLMNNPPMDKSDDSFSNISASNRNSSLSSGHRSLERLEVNYETPNNRDKFRDKTNTKSSTKIPTPAFKTPGLTLPSTPAQKLMDDYLKKPKSNTKPENHLPILIKSKTVAVSPAVDTPQVKTMDCDDILDQLYGDDWREQAGVLLPTTEPKKKVELRDRGVQTDCIRKPKKLLGSSDSSTDEGFRRFIKDLPTNVNSTKRIPPKYKYRDSFIVHSSESEESTGDTTYMTALTNPRLSTPKNPKSKETPMTLTTRKAIEICDSDSDSDRDTPRRKDKDNRKKLVFSDDEDVETSGTSEYDPDDIVPPKTVIPRIVKPLIKPTSKIPTRTLLPPRPEFKRKSFLASLSASVPIEQCHQDAKKYRLNFKNTKDELIRVLYKIFNEKVFDNRLPPDMLIEWNVRLRGTAGYCYNTKVKKGGALVRTARIELSTKVCDNADRIRDTLVHEMCHAGTWLINEVRDGHGRFWKAWAAKAMRTFPELPPVSRCHDYQIATKFTYRCTQCGYSFGRHSKSLDIERKRCGKCYGRFELLMNRVTKSGTMQQIPKTPANTKQPSGFALFVKENYSTVKQQQKGRPHKEVMQLLGQQFSAIKLSKQNERKSPEESP